MKRATRIPGPTAGRTIPSGGAGAGGKAVLAGNVPARWIKHAVEDAASDTRGVIPVENQIRVGPAAP